jgi:peptidoglycan/xylan/chitin deacetylase (PgdA/CDA1 family)
MLRLIPPTPPLSAAEQFALDALVDQSRVLPVDGGDVVELRLVGSGATLSLSDARARKWCVTAHDGFVELERPLLTLVAELAGAVLEQRSGSEDRYGRVPPVENAMVRARSEQEPVVGQMAVALRAAAVAGAQRRPFALLVPWPKGKRWAIAVTHDLDVVALWPAYSMLRVAQLAANMDLRRAATVAGSMLGSLAANPVWRATENILKRERDLGIRSTWFVIAGTPTLATIRAGDVTYLPESPRVRRIVDAARTGGHEIGLHGSFASYDNRAVFVQQRARLEQAAGITPNGVRQHFLRMRPGRSHIAMAESGFTYDSTYGFAERNGFRLGVADVIPVWSEEQRQVTPIDEAPFVWMDRALSKYQRIEDPAVWIDDARATARSCREVDGLWTGIWHPNLDDALGFPGAPAAFEKLLRDLLEHSPWSGTLGEIVEWRRERRAARGSVDASGRVRLRAPAGKHRLSLEDPAGKPIEAV